MVIIWLMMLNDNLVGGWPKNPSEKWWSSSVGMMIIPNRWKNKSHVPNHQPGYVDLSNLSWCCHPLLRMSLKKTCSPSVSHLIPGAHPGMPTRANFSRSVSQLFKTVRKFKPFEIRTLSWGYSWIPPNHPSRPFQYWNWSLWAHF